MYRYLYYRRIPIKGYGNGQMVEEKQEAGNYCYGVLQEKHKSYLFANL
jgi:hypothetical protein